MNVTLPLISTDTKDLIFHGGIDFFETIEEFECYHEYQNVDDGLSFDSEGQIIKQIVIGKTIPLVKVQATGEYNPEDLSFLLRNNLEPDEEDVTEEFIENASLLELVQYYLKRKHEWDSRTWRDWPLFNWLFKR